MAKNIRRMLAMVLVMCMFVSALPMQALAAEGETITVTETITGGTIEIEFSPSGDVTVSGTNENGSTVELTGTSTTTSTSSTASNGNVTESTTTKVELTGKETSTDSNIKDGIYVTYEDTTTSTTVTDANGNLVSEKETNKGSETKEWTESDTGDGVQPEVVAPIVPGETSTATGGVTTETVTNPNGSTTTTTTTDRTVTTTTSKTEVTVNDSGTGLVEDQEAVLTGPAPVYDETDNPTDNDKNGKFDDATGKDGLFDRNYLSTNTGTDTSKWTDIPPEGEYRYVGTGEHSKYFAGLIKVIYKKDADGNTVYNEDGTPIIDKLVNATNNSDQTSNGELLDHLVPEYEIDSGFSGSRAQNFMLMDVNGNRVYAYCCDAETGTVAGTWYSVSNLEDSEYYTPEAEDHIRAIALNGYWGTTDIPDENGKYAQGSLESIKAKMIAAINNGDIDRYVQVPVRDTSTEGAGKIQVDEDGQPIYYEEPMDLLEILAGMTEGEALLATQAAIWSFANGAEGALSGVDGAVVVTPDWYRNHQIGYNKSEGEPLDDAAGARVAALYNWLMTLDSVEQTTTIINEKNVFEDMSITVHEKDGTHENNADEDQDNDVYNTDLNFKLAFIPGKQDDLLVQITYKDLDGNDVNIVRRLAGTNSEGQTYEDIKPESDGSYVLKGLKLSENKDFSFDLRLEGTQYLENGVYVYAPVGGRDVSQTFVGVAEGTRNVDVSVGVTINFDVDEDNHVVAETKWESEYDPNYTPPTPHTPALTNLEPEAAPQVFRLANQNVEEIPEEPVPLAAPVITGDNSGLWIAVILLSVFAMAAINLFDKKRQQETF